ncbi:MAG: MmcQ/YjbR family DNA-binding protein [Candidatus Limiplasma sp.]|nr:MmcQ/YjbR family DNA-binding protein [Candidatus Limiplasma sp.]
MTPQEILDDCMTKPGAYLDCPFGPEPVCARVERRIFAQVYPGRGWVTLKCEPIQGLAWRERYPQSVRRGYHCPPVQQPYHNTVALDGTVEDGELRAMIAHSYERALKSLTREARARAAKGTIMGR